MPVSVSDARSNANEQIDHVVEKLGRAAQRIAVFKAIYRGKAKAKTVAEIAAATGLSRIRVLQEGGRLAANLIVAPTRKNGDTAYEKDTFIAAQRSKIFALVKDPKKRAKFPTKRRPQASGGAVIHLSLPRKQVQVVALTIDDIDSFAKVRKVDSDDQAGDVYEAKIKGGVKAILGDAGKFTDWGGEKSDLFSTRLRIGGKRYATAFAFKGRGTKGILTPAKLGKNGDQIQRLFRSEAQVFVVQYGGQVDESVREQMQMAATAKSFATEQKVYYMVIDGQDTSRLMRAYPKAFSSRRSRKRK